MEDVIIEQKKILKLACYKAVKFRGLPEAACPYGFTEIRPDCSSCMWLETKVGVSGTGRKMVVDRLVAKMPLDSPQRITDAETVKRIPPIFFQEGELVAPPPPEAMIRKED